ncbi:putative RWD domain-containing protein [Helianthus debilis subsp. tardiflorus]
MFAYVFQYQHRSPLKKVTRDYLKIFQYLKHYANMTDYVQEQEMEIEALKAILMDEFEEIHPSESGLNTSNRCFQIKISLQDDETESNDTVQLGLVFSHTHKYPDEIPLLNLRSIKGISASDLTVLKEKLEQEASENLGMAMIYSLVTSSKEWVAERFAHDTGDYDILEEAANKDEIIVPHGEPVTVETFLAWREKFEAELALERAKLLPESALVTTKEKKLTGKQWFESGRASKRAAPIIEGSNDEDEDIDFDDDDDDNNSEVDEEDMLDHYLAEKLDPSNQGR